MDENPYESPKVPATSSNKASGGKIALAIVFGLLAIPAGAIAFFTTCVATIGFGDSVAPLVISSIVGIATIIGMCYLSVRTGRSK